MAGFRGGFGGFGGGNQMQQLMKQAQKMQAEMQKAQEELENAEIVGVAQGDAVKVVLNGKKVVSSITINPDYVDVDDIEIGDDVEMVFRRIREDGKDGVISYGYKFKVIK